MFTSWLKMGLVSKRLYESKIQIETKQLAGFGNGRET
jgi:hypothetical protein